MRTQTIELAPAKRTIGMADVVAYAGAAAFFVAAAWYGLAAKGVTEASAPRVGPHIGLQQGLHIYYRWLSTTFLQERLYVAVAIVGFLCLTGVAVFARDLLGRERGAVRSGVYLVGSGAGLWIAGSVLQLGGHHAVGLMATHANPVETVASIAFVVDMIAAAFALAAFALIGVGMLAFAAAARELAGQGLARQGLAGLGSWAGYTALVALAMLVTAVSYAVGSGDLSDVLLLAGGVVLLPVWLIWTRFAWAGRIGERTDTSADAM